MIQMMMMDRLVSCVMILVLAKVVSDLMLDD